MLFKDVIELIEPAYTENDLGDPVEDGGTIRTVFANKKSVRQSEFYQAAQTDIRPELMFEVRTAEYQAEPKLRHEGKMYNVIRTFDKNGELTELIVSGLVGE